LRRDRAIFRPLGQAGEQYFLEIALNRDAKPG
jgi:hypothetical protein